MNDTAGAQAGAANLDAISFEEALRELEGIVASLERGDVSLDDAIAAFGRGTAEGPLQARLEEARMKVEQIRLPADGGAPESATPFSADERGMTLPPSVRNDAAAVEAHLQTIFDEMTGPADRLTASMRYATMNGGKRLRACLVMAAERLASGGEAGSGLIEVAASVECLHAYS